MKKYLLCFVSLCLCMFSVNSHAIVNLGNIHLEEPALGVHGKVKLGLDGNIGNSERFRTSLGFRTQWYQPNFLQLLMLTQNYGESFGKQDQNNAFLHYRIINSFRPSTASETFAQLESNEFARLNYRGLFGGGVRFDLSLPERNLATFLGLGGFYSQESIQSVGGLADSGTQDYFRANIYGVVDYAFNAYVRVSSTTYFQPDIAHVADFRLLEDASLIVTLTKTLELSLDLTAVHDNEPPLSIKKTDASFAVGLGYNF